MSTSNQASAQHGRIGAVIQAEHITGPVTVIATTPWVPPTPRQLATPLPRYTNRSAELDRLAILAARPRDTVRLVCVSGPAGIGKSALITEWAARAAADFPDGQILLSLRGPEGPSDAGTALAAGLRALRVPGEHIPPTTHERVGLWRSLTTDRRLLVVAENAGTSAQIRPLIPAGECLLVVASRSAVPELILDGCAALHLDPLTAAESTRLLQRLLPEDTEDLDLSSAVTACAGVPLSLALRAGHLDHTPHFVTPAPSRGPLEAITAMNTDTALTHLPPPDRDHAALLALAPTNRHTTPACAALWNTSHEQTEQTLDRLTHAGILTPEVHQVWRMHAVVREAADRLLYTLALDRRTASTRLLDHYEHTAAHASMAVQPDRLLYDHPFFTRAATTTPFTGLDTGLAWFDAEADALAVVVHRASAAGRHRTVLRLAEAARPWLHRTADLHLWARLVDLGRTAARTEKDPRSVVLVAGMANALARRHRDYSRALHDAQECLDATENLGDPRLKGTAHEFFGATWSEAGRPDEAIEHHRSALALHTQHGTPRGRALQARFLARALNDAGQPAEGIALARQAARDLSNGGDERQAAKALLVLARGLLTTGETQASESAAREALARATDTRAAYDAAHADLILADLAHHHGDTATETTHLHAALQPLRTLAPHQAAEITERLSQR